MKVIAYMAISINGDIADAEGKEDFLSDVHWKGFSDLLATHGAYVMGHTSYKSVTSWGEPYAADLAKARGFVLSRTPGKDRYASPEDALQAAEEAGCMSIVLAGGASTNAAFASRGLISELIMSVEPIVLGAGKPAFDAFIGSLKMKLLSTSTDESHGIVRMHYAVL